MILQNSIFIIAVTIFIIITITFAHRYCKLITLAQKEYEKAKDIISGIIYTFKKRVDKQDETIDKLIFDVEATRFSIQKMTNKFQGLDSKLKEIDISPESSSIIQKEIKSNLEVLEKEVKIISNNENKLERKLLLLEEKIQYIGKAEKSLITLEKVQPLSKLTATELLVLKLIMSGEAKTAPEVEEKIGKTREHTARLMKKLWQEGYIERNTHRIPYSYHITENLKKIKITDLNPS